jgi:hypothetical protein
MTQKPRGSRRVVTVLSPTVGVSGNDGGFRDPYEGYTGWEVPTVMLNGNVWAIGPSYPTLGYGGTNVSYSNTFPDVTLPADGTAVDMSFAAKVQGTCFTGSGYGPPYGAYYAFYLDTFVDGHSPAGISPGPCWVVNGLYPGCPFPWPALWTLRPQHGAHVDLDSQAVAGIALKANTRLKRNLVPPANCGYNKFNIWTCVYGVDIYCTPPPTIRCITPHRLRIRRVGRTGMRGHTAYGFQYQTHGNAQTSLTSLFRRMPTRWDSPLHKTRWHAL